MKDETSRKCGEAVDLGALVAVEAQGAGDAHVELEDAVLQVLARLGGVGGEALGALDGDLYVVEAVAAGGRDADGEVGEGELLARVDEHVLHAG